MEPAAGRQKERRPGDPYLTTIANQNRSLRETKETKQQAGNIVRASEVKGEEVRRDAAAPAPEEISNRVAFLGYLLCGSGQLGLIFFLSRFLFLDHERIRCLAGGW